MYLCAKTIKVILALIEKGEKETCRICICESEAKFWSNLLDTFRIKFCFKSILAIDTKQLVL